MTMPAEAAFGESTMAIPYKEFEFTFDSLLDTSLKIEVDPEMQDYGRLEGISLTESIFEYQKENGRTYHAYKAGSYLFPNDQQEMERLENQHEIMKIVKGGRNFLAPWTQANPPTKVLDVATGTGRWAIEVGDEFPSAEVIGIDLSPTQPTLVPPNVTFYVDDACEGDWSSEELDGVDYIHTRFTAGCWDSFQHQVVNKAYHALQPGGWLECQEKEARLYSDDGTLAPDAPLVRWVQGLADAGNFIGRPLNAAASLRGWFEDAGFVDVQEKVYKLPFSGWPRDPRLKRLGDMWQLNMMDALPAFSYAFMHRVLGKTKEEIELALVDVRKDINNPEVHAYGLYHVVCGRKPTAEEMVLSSSAASTKTTWSSASTLATDE